MSVLVLEQALATCILEIVNRNGSADFTLDEVYQYTARLEQDT